MIDSLRVDIRDTSYARVVSVPLEGAKFEVTKPMNDVADWKLTLPIDTPALAFIESGCGIYVTYNGVRLVNGPMDEFETFEQGGPPSVITISGISDSTIFEDRLMYPTPSQPNATLQTTEVDRRTGAAETMMHAYLNVNIGADAPAARKVNNILRGEFTNIGPTVSYSARWEPLMVLMKDMSSRGEIVFDMAQVGTNLRLETSATRDLSRDFELSVSNGTLISCRRVARGPGAQRYIAGGKGSGTSRTVQVLFGPSHGYPQQNWGRTIEKFIDASQTSDLNDLDQVLRSEIANTGSAMSDYLIVPSPTCPKFGRDWRVGDLLSIRTTMGLEKIRVSGVKVVYDGQKISLGLTVGDPSRFSEAAAQRASVRNLGNRLSGLEAHR